MNYKKLAALAAIHEEPPAELLSVLAQAGSEAQGLLTFYRRPKLARKLRIIEKCETPQIPKGDRLLLFKHPIPGEAQARLAYEYVFERFTQFLERRNFAVAESQSTGHLMLWFPNKKPEKAEVWLEAEWQAFLTELTSAEGFRDSFALALNSSKLAGGAGFATIKTPIFNAQHATSLAGLYWVAMGKGLEVNRRNFAKAKELEEKTQTSEKPKDREKALVDAKKELDKATKFKAEVFEFFKSDIKKNPQSRTAQVLQAVLEACGDDLQALPKQFKELFPDTFKAVEEASSSYGATAREQLNSARGDIFRKIVWEMVRLAEREYEAYALPALLSLEPFSGGLRSAGDANSQFCYSCGRALTEQKNAFDSGRLLFENPEQRAQSAGSSNSVKVCATCAGLSLLGPVKFTGESLVIYLKGEDSGVVERTREILERQALSELGASAGRYISLLATEKSEGGDPAPQVWGRKQYAIVKLGLTLPTEIFVQSQNALEFILYEKGNEVLLNRAALFATSAFARAYQQSIREGNKLNGRLGRAVRYFERGQWFLGEFELLRGMAEKNFIPLFLLQQTEPAREELVKLMNNIEGERYKDVVAYATLMYAFTERARREMKGLKDEDLKREMSKLVQLSGGESPISFTNRTLAAGQTKSEGLGYATARLYFNDRFGVSYEWAKELLGKPEQQDEKEGRFFEVTPDDLIQAQLKLMGKPNLKSPGDWKNFRYQVKLYLFTRYPKLMQG